MTNILCCYVHLRDETKDCLSRYAPGAVLREIDPIDPYQYWNEIASFWENDEDLLIIEPDMFFNQAQLDSLINCPEPWCLYGYDIGGSRTDFSLGFTKFSHRLRSVLKDTLPACSYCYGAWFHLDVHLSDAFTEAGYRAHDHGTVEHLHEYRKPTSAMHMEIWEGPEVTKREITKFLKTQGWQGPEHFRGHEHGKVCSCVWSS